MAFSIKVNGSTRSVDVDGDTPLLWVLRDVLGMTGTKFGCGQALCGACTVHVDGAATRSCITTVDSIGESAITTIEAIGQAPQGTALQKAWLELEVVQCGYCNGEQFRLAPNGMVDQSRARDVRQQSRLGNQPWLIPLRGNPG
jgi:isoquinoline 1-oxidoreductase subunit alpha